MSDDYEIDEQVEADEAEKNDSSAFYLEKKAFTSDKPNSFSFGFSSKGTDEKDVESSASKRQKTSRFVENLVQVSDDPAQCFFFGANDERLQEGLDFFNEPCNDSMEEVREKFEEEKARLKAIVKKRVKSKMARLKSEKQLAAKIERRTKKNSWLWKKKNAAKKNKNN